MSHENLSKLIAKKTYIGAGALIFDISTERILVVHGPVKWSLPKGHAESGEKSHETAMREIYEETGLRFRIDCSQYSKKIRKYIYYYISVKDTKNLVLSPVDTTEVSEAKWCSIEELITMQTNRQLDYFINRWESVLRYFVPSRIKPTSNLLVDDHFSEEPHSLD